MAGQVQSWLVLPLSFGQGLRELIEVMRADQLTLGWVAARRHCPVVTGYTAMPDGPPRVLTPQQLDQGVLAGPAPAGAHHEDQRAGHPMSSAKNRVTS